MVFQEQAGSRGPQEEAPRRGLWILLVLVTLLTVGLGVAKLAVQREHPPPHVIGESNTYEGFVSIDQYCRRAERIRDRVFAAAEDRAAAHQRLRDDLTLGTYPTALLVPAAVGVLSRWTGSIPLTFATLSVGALLVQLLALIALGTRLGRECGGRTVGLAAAILMAGHVNAARAAAQLLIDPFAVALALLCVLLTLAWRARPGRRTALLLIAVQVLGTFVKLTYLPLLAAPALIELVAGGRRRLARALRAGLLFGLVPALPVLAYLVAVPGWGSFSSEMVRAVDSSSLTARELRNFAIEMVLLLQVLPLLWLAGRRVSGAARAEGDGIVVMLVVFVVSILGIQLPDDYRLYLPALGLLTAVAAPGVVRLAGPRLVAVLALYAAGNAGVAAYGLLSQLPR